MKVDCKSSPHALLCRRITWNALSSTFRPEFIEAHVARESATIPLFPLCPSVPKFNDVHERHITMNRVDTAHIFSNLPSKKNPCCFGVVHKTAPTDWTATMRMRDNKNPHLHIINPTMRTHKMSCKFTNHSALHTSNALQTMTEFNDPLWSSANFVMPKMVWPAISTLAASE